MGLREQALLLAVVSAMLWHPGLAPLLQLHNIAYAHMAVAVAAAAHGISSSSSSSSNSSSSRGNGTFGERRHLGFYLCHAVAPRISTNPARVKQHNTWSKQDQLLDMGNESTCLVGASQGPVHVHQHSRATHKHYSNT
jgi:hypothetical protein